MAPLVSLVSCQLSMHALHLHLACAIQEDPQSRLTNVQTKGLLISMANDELTTMAMLLQYNSYIPCMNTLV